MTPSRPIDSNLDSEFVENKPVYVVPDIGRGAPPPRLPLFDLPVLDCNKLTGCN